MINKIKIEKIIRNYNYIYHRPIRSTLKEALKEEKKLNNLEDTYNYIIKSYNNYTIKEELKKIEIIYTGIDNREDIKETFIIAINDKAYGHIYFKNKDKIIEIKNKEIINQRKLENRLIDLGFRQEDIDIMLDK